MTDSRKCPDCGERLAIDARVCVCGWKPGRFRSSPEPHNMVCVWTSGMLHCTYPVGLFIEGARSGFCIFHRRIKSGPQAAAIARESEGHTQDEYNARARKEVYGDAPPKSVQDLQKRI